MLEARWVRAHADEFDVMHVHFGFDDQSPDALRQLTDALTEHRKPFVLTVHDLRNPHHGEPELHDAQLGVLVSAADAVITLTPGAAAEIRRRWGRDAHVLPHPHVVDEATLSRQRREHDGFVVGVHVKSLRANMDPLPVIEQIVGDLTGMPGASLRVDAHTDVMRHDGRPQASSASPRAWRDWPLRAGSTCTCTTTSPTTSSGTTCPPSTCPCCPTGSGPTPAGSRPASTSERSSWLRTAGTTPSSGRA